MSYIDTLLERRSQKFVPNKTYPTAPDKEAASTRLLRFVLGGIQRGQTVQVLGSHGTGKTQTMKGLEDVFEGKVSVITLEAATLTLDDLLINGMVRDGDDSYRLTELLMDKLHDCPTEHFILHIDDLRQIPGGGGLLNQMMQVAASWELGSYDLRKFGCIGVVLTDNEDLTQTAMQVQDLAILDRMSTIRIDENDTEWREALAAKYADHDLKPVFEARATLPSELRSRVMSPRRLDHMIGVLLEGLPGYWALPIVNGKRVLLETVTDNKTTSYSEVIGKFAAALGAPNPEKVADPLRRSIEAAARNTWAILVQGGPGTGKSKYSSQVIRDLLGVDPAKNYFSMSTTNVDSWLVPAVVDGKLRTLLRDNFIDGENKIITIDEYNRVTTKAMFAKMMGLTGSWTIADHKIEGLKAIVAIQNPPVVMGRKMLVQKNNLSQADRFAINLDIQPGDIPTNDWFLTEFPSVWARQQATSRNLFGLEADDEDAQFDKDAREAAQVAEIVLEWWKSDIPDSARQYVTARGMVRLASHALLGEELEPGLIAESDGGYVPVPLHDLKNRLENRTVTSLKAIVDDLDNWLETMRGEKDGQYSHGSVKTDIVNAVLDDAEVSQIEDNFEAVVQLMALMPRRHITMKVSSNPEKSKIFMKVLAEVGRRKQAQQAS